MTDLRYKIIKSEEQYDKYCQILEKLVFKDNGSVKEDEVELLTLLIKDWDERYALGYEYDPVELIKSLKDDHGLNQTDLARIAGVGKSYISEILNYKKKMSKKVIRKLANHFKIQQEALNRRYKLDGEKVNSHNRSTVLS
jgi:HTH-type transcriptional regulator/antitoxin HigA